MLSRNGSRKGASTLWAQGPETELYRGAPHCPVSPTAALCHVEKWGGSRGPCIHTPLPLKGRGLFLTPHPTFNNCPKWKVLEPGYGEPTYQVTLRLTTKSSRTAGAIT